MGLQCPKNLSEIFKKKLRFLGAQLRFLGGQLRRFKNWKIRKYFWKFNIPKTEGAFGDPKSVEVHNTPCHSTGSCKYCDFFKY